MSEVTLVPVDPTPDDVQYLEDRISEFNSSATGIADGELLAFFVRERGRIVAGISGNTWGGTCEVRQFWWTSRNATVGSVRNCSGRPSRKHVSIERCRELLGEDVESMIDPDIQDTLPARATSLS